MQNIVMATTFKLLGPPSEYLTSTQQATSQCETLLFPSETVRSGPGPRPPPPLAPHPAATRPPPAPVASGKPRPSPPPPGPLRSGHPAAAPARGKATHGACAWREQVGGRPPPPDVSAEVGGAAAAAGRAEGTPPRASGAGRRRVCVAEGGAGRGRGRAGAGGGAGAGAAALLLLLPPLGRMVFESLVVDVLNRFLGDYVVNLDSSQLKLGIWGGTGLPRRGGTRRLPRPGPARASPAAPGSRLACLPACLPAAALGTPAAPPARPGSGPPCRPREGGGRGGGVPRASGWARPCRARRRAGLPARQRCRRSQHLPGRLKIAVGAGGLGRRCPRGAWSSRLAAAAGPGGAAKQGKGDGGRSARGAGMSAWVLFLRAELALLPPPGWRGACLRVWGSARRGGLSREVWGGPGGQREPPPAPAGSLARLCVNAKPAWLTDGAAFSLPGNKKLKINARGFGSALVPVKGAANSSDMPFLFSVQLPVALDYFWR